MIGIYKIQSPTGRIYIGQSIDIERRFRFYTNLNCKLQPLLYRSLLKYGSDKHSFIVVEECDFELLNERERYWQDFYDVLNGGLNCNLTETSIQPKRHSQETKDKISKSNMDKPKSAEAKRNMSETKKKTSLGTGNNFFGKNHSIEFKSKRSIDRSDSGNPKAKLVLNLETGIYYGSCKEASNTCEIPQSRLTSWLNGRYPNKSSFIYV